MLASYFPRGLEGGGGRERGDLILMADDLHP